MDENWDDGNDEPCPGTPNLSEKLGSFNINPSEPLNDCLNLKTPSYQQTQSSNNHAPDEWDENENNSNFRYQEKESDALDGTEEGTPYDAPVVKKFVRNGGNSTYNSRPRRYDDANDGSGATRSTYRGRYQSYEREPGEVGNERPSFRGRYRGNDNSEGFNSERSSFRGSDRYGSSSRGESYSSERGFRSYRGRGGYGDRSSNFTNNTTNYYEENPNDNQYGQQRPKRDYQEYGGTSRNYDDPNAYQENGQERSTKSYSRFKEDQQEFISETERPPIYNPEMPSTDPDVIFSSTISEGIHFEQYESIKVKVSGGDERQDYITSFDHDSHVSSEILSNVKKANYRVPTPIQKFTIPIVTKEMYDIMGCAQTGSGKTAAYLIPIFSNILKNQFTLNENSIASPLLLIMAPTRELVIQIGEEMRKFSYGTRIRTGIIYGGVSRSFIYRFIRNGCDAIAATPGRLTELVDRNEVSLKNVKYLVLDEADRMLDMGFIEPIRKIVFQRGLPPSDQRRCYMFSATFPNDIRNLAKEILAPDYFFITVGVVGGAADSINQEIFEIPPQDKRDKLLRILENFKERKVLIFVETKRSADFLTTFLCQSSIRSTSIHGDRFQEQREEALNMFKKGEALVLVATSVAARGLDIPKVDLVINFDLPSQIEEYVHRIGRTGRLGNNGMAISFFTPGKDETLSSQLVEVLKNANQNIPPFLKHYDFAPTSITQSSFQSRDDRSLSIKTHNIRNFSGGISGSNPTEEVSSFVDAVDEGWD